MVLCVIISKDWLCEFRAYDRAAIKFRGVDADLNFNLSDYDEDMKQVIRNLKYKFSVGFFIFGFAY